MKKLTILIGLIIVLSMLLFSTGAVAYASTGIEETALKQEEIPFDWGVWFKEKVLPILIGGGMGLVSVCSMLFPVLNSVNGGIRLFKKAKGDYEGVALKVIETQSAITEFKETSLAKITEFALNVQSAVELIAEKNKLELNDIKAKVSEVLQLQGIDIETIAEQLKNLVKIAKIGFGNNGELVKNGYASMIMNMGVKDENTQTEEEYISNNNS